MSLTHALMTAGEAAMVVALADSFFFDVDPNAARSRLLAFLLATFAPFLVVAPLIGPAIDRVSGGRRFMVIATASARMVVQVTMVFFVDGWVLFPLVFAALVLQKTYIVSKSALVPSVVSSERELVEANSKLGVIAGLSGTAAVAPAAVLQVTIGAPATLVYSAGLFAGAVVAGLELPNDRGSGLDRGRAADRPRRGPRVQVAALEPHQARLYLASAAMTVVRAMVGFMLFHLAFWYRGRPDERTLLAVAVAAAALATLAGNSIAPRLRRLLPEERMLVVALAFPAVAGLAAGFAVGPQFGVIVAVVVNFSAAIARLSFESIVQRDGDPDDRGADFARFETRFQLGWVIGAVLPVALEIPGRLGLLLVGAVSAVTLVNYVVGVTRP